MVDDPVRKLEMEQGKLVDLNQPVCRFCNKTFKVLSRHRCKQQGAYIDKLKTPNVTINNVNCNNTKCNVKESTVVIERWRQLKLTHGDDLYLLAANLVVFLDPQNNNVLLTSAKALTVTESGWEIKS